MDGKDVLHRLDFDNHGLLDDKVGSISQGNGDPVVSDREGFFDFERQFHARQLVTEAYLIRLFEQTWSKARVHGVCSAEDGIG